MSDEPKKRYVLVYGAVIVLYVIMIIVYSLVVHNATVNGAAENVPCVESDLNPCPDTPPNASNTLNTNSNVIELLASAVSSAFAN